MSRRSGKSQRPRIASSSPQDGGSVGDCPVTSQTPPSQHKEQHLEPRKEVSSGDVPPPLPPSRPHALLVRARVQITHWRTLLVTRVSPLCARCASHVQCCCQHRYVHPILRLGRRAARVLCSTRMALALSICLFLTQLGSVGLGLVHHWTRMSEQLLRVQQLKLEEAQILAAAAEAQQLRPTRASNPPAGTSLTLPAEPSLDTGNNNPLLEARDVNTILEQEDMSDMLEKLAREDEARIRASQQQQDASASPSAEASNSAAQAKREEEFQRLSRTGITALIAGDMRLCILSLSQASTIHPDNPALLYYHGLAYDKLLNPNKAREYYMQLFNMRDEAGEYFKKASQRLTYGFANPEAMRGKLAFGPHLVRVDYQSDRGENVEAVFPILLAPGEDIRPEDVYIHIQFFDLAKGGDIQISHHEPTMTWENATPSWADGEERLIVHYSIPIPTQEQLDAFGEMKYYGFTAKLYYRGEPLDCISTPSSLILREYQLQREQDRPQGNFELLPDEDIFSTDQALPASDSDLPLIEGAGSDGLVPL